MMHYTRNVKWRILKGGLFEHTCAYARWAHMHRFLSVRLWLDQNWLDHNSWLDQNSYLRKWSKLYGSIAVRPCRLQLLRICEPASCSSVHQLQVGSLQRLVAFLSFWSDLIWSIFWYYLLVSLIIIFGTFLESGTTWCLKGSHAVGMEMVSFATGYSLAPHLLSPPVQVARWALMRHCLSV